MNRVRGKAISERHRGNRSWPRERPCQHDEALLKQHRITEPDTPLGAPQQPN
ncbi:MAG: hypothetical protein WBE79_13945 [Candidatus Cybelea sp.]